MTDHTITYTIEAIMGGALAWLAIAVFKMKGRLAKVEATQEHKLKSLDRIWEKLEVLARQQAEAKNCLIRVETILKFLNPKKEP